MGEGGTLTITTENVHFPDESLSPQPEMRPGRYIMLSVSDTGSGMDEATRSHLFEPFFTTKETGKGTGLGLAMVYGIVKQSKGFIYVYSKTGRGTTVKLYFPRIDKKPIEIRVKDSSSQELRGTERILVLEDEQQVLSIIENMLTHRGYSVITASSGQAAAALSQHDSGPIDLLITDLGIPDMSGREVWTTIRKGHPNCKVLFISGYPEDFVALEDIGDGQKIFLQKPFGSESLLTRVREILSSLSPADQ
jgi:CheY-like chemotaxis protein